MKAESKKVKALVFVIFLQAGFSLCMARKHYKDQQKYYFVKMVADVLSKRLDTCLQGKVK